MRFVVSEDFGAKLNRWSQRKQAARRGAALDEAAEELRRDASAEPPATDGPVEMPATDDSTEEAPTLPPVDTLSAESDYTVFLAQNVPEALKHAALRKLWRSDPVLANLDGLNDYDEDFNAVETLVDTVRSVYRAGKGYIDEAEETVGKQEPASDEFKPAESPNGIAAASGENDGTDIASMGYNDAVGGDLSHALRQEVTADSDAAANDQAESEYKSEDN